MEMETSNWSYNEFLAFLLIYAAEMNYPLSQEELKFIQSRTQIQNVEKIKSIVDKLSDIAALDLIEDYRNKYLSLPEKAQQAKTDLDNLLQTEGLHSQLEKAAVHILEKIL